LLSLSGGLLKGEVQTVLSEFNELARHGKDLGKFLGDLLQHLRNLLVFQITKGDTRLLEVSEAEAATLSGQSTLVSADALTRVMEALTQTESGLRDAASKKIYIEVALIKAIEARNSVSIDAVLKRLRTVEGKLRDAAGNSQLQIRCYVDTGPLVERVYAKYAGIGWIGKNTCILNQKLGSWLFLGVILTSIELESDLPAPDRCGSCTRCIDACPTDALVAPYQLDSNRCISYLTIEKRGAIAEELRTGMGHEVFGCDICQDVCPWNRKAPATGAAEFQPRVGLVNPALEWLAGMTGDEFREKFRGSALRRTKRSGLRRNAVIAMGNSGDGRFAPLLERLKTDPDPVVAESAAWAANRISGVARTT